MRNLRVGILGFDGLTALDLVGPHEAFGAASDTLRASEASAGYKLAIIGVTRRPFHATSGLVITPQFQLDTAPPLDTLIIPGGPGLRVPALNRRVAQWIREREPKTRRVVSVCTGIYALAASGLLDGRRVTTHWYHAADVARRFPGLRVDPDALFVRDGKFYTSAGITAGIDLALELIEEDFGRRTALTVARGFVVYLKRPGGQEQYSEPLQFQFQSANRVGDVAQWMARNLKKDLSVEVLAERATLSVRHFSRRFKAVTGQSAGAYAESLRLGEGRNRLVESRSNIAAIAASVGFASADSFRRAFERRYGISPTGYRARFSSLRAR
jgi:transcriptional regulator GlxA family with amidase domain